MRLTPLSLLLCVPLAAQTINPNQIRPSATAGQVLTTVAGTPNTTQWSNGSGVVPVWPNIYYSATAPNNGFTYASVIIGGTGYTVTIPNNCPGTFGNATADATLSTALVFTDATTSTVLCTLTFTSSSAHATVTGSGGTLSSGDLISLTVATADMTLAGVTAELSGTTPGGPGGGGGGGSMTWPTGGAGIPNYNGSLGWGTTYNSGNQIPQSWVAIGNIPGNAGTATALVASPSQCLTGYAPTGILANGNANGCAPLASSYVVNSGSNYALYSAGSPAATIAYPSNIKTDSSGNNLIVPGSITAGVGAVLFSALPTCNTALGPSIRSISDPAVTTWGSTASGTGTAGTTNELVFCDAGTGSGTWTVFAK